MRGGGGGGGGRCEADAARQCVLEHAGRSAPHELRELHAAAAGVERRRERHLVDPFEVEAAVALLAQRAAAERGAPPAVLGVARRDVHVGGEEEREAVGARRVVVVVPARHALQRRRVHCGERLGVAHHRRARRRLQRAQSRLGIERRPRAEARPQQQHRQQREHAAQRARRCDRRPPHLTLQPARAPPREERQRRALQRRVLRLERRAQRRGLEELHKGSMRSRGANVLCAGRRCAATAGRRCGDGRPCCDGRERGSARRASSQLESRDPAV